MRSCLVANHIDSVRGDRFETIVCDYFFEHSQPGDGGSGDCSAYCDP